MQGATVQRVHFLQYGADKPEILILQQFRKNSPKFHKLPVCIHTFACYNKEEIRTSLETLQIFWKPGSATSQSIIMAAHKIGLFTNKGTNEQNEKISCNN